MNDKPRQSLPQTEWVAWREAIFDAALDCIIVIDGEGDIFEVNSAAETMFGFDRDDVIGSPMAELIIPPRMRDAHHAGLSRIRKTGVGQILGERLELPAQKIDGTEFPVELTVVRINVDGPAMFVGYVRDISEQKRAEEALRLTQFSVDSAAYSVFWIRPDSYISYANDEACRCLGYERDELLKMSVMDITPEFPREQWSQHWQDLIAQGSLTFESHHVGKDGSHFPVEITANYLEYDGRQYNCAIAIDITERQRIEQQLISALAEAKSANRAKSEFLAVVSHEMRTPLNGITAVNSLLAETELDNRQQDYVRTIQSSSKRLTNLIDDLLDFSQIEAGKFELREAEFSPKQLIADVIKYFADDASERGLEIRPRIYQSIPDVLFGDSGRLQQVLDNLLSNAIKFTPSGFIEIQAMELDRSPEHSTLEFQVIDSGVGIKHEDRERIFSKFEQGDGSATREFGGIGLGLSICAKLTTMLGGDIKVFDGPSGGTGFRFTARFSRRPVGGPSTLAQNPLNRKQEENETRRTIERRPLRVLLAEDDSASQIATTHILQSAGYEVVVAGDGVEAVEEYKKAESDHFDLILMDLMMPHCNGQDATRKIRSLEPDGERVPIIALTAQAMKEDRLACLDSGMDEFLSKPIDKASLLACIDETVFEATPLGSSREGSGARDGDMVFDPVLLCEQCDGNGFIVDQLIRTFLDSSASLHKDIRSSFEEGDRDSLLRYTHKLKGSVSNMCAHEAFQAAASLYSQARNANSAFDQLESCVDDLTEKMEQLNSALQAKLDRHGEYFI